MDSEAIQMLEHNKIKELRRKAGLATKKHRTRTYHHHEVLSNPDPVEVTDIKSARGFTYVNLNGGDSFGYYHPDEQPDVLFNFKGEPNYKTKELCPDYHAKASEQADQTRTKRLLLEQQKYIADQGNEIDNSGKTGGVVHMAFRDESTDQYYIGCHDFHRDEHNFNPTSSKSKISDYLAQHGVARPKLVETWEYKFQPDESNSFDLKRRFINQYKPSNYMKRANAANNVVIPQTIHRVINHALGGDADVVEHFLNWLTVIARLRIRTQTAWVLQGTVGTGKGVLFNHIIRPLIGEDYSRSITIQNLEDNFNKFWEKTIVLFVDEVDTDQVKDMPKLIARLKNMITEEKLPIRAMRTDLQERASYMNIIMASNQPNSMRIETNDRRFNVCPRQEKALLVDGESGEKLINQINQELQDFADYLASREPDTALARIALDTKAKRSLQATTQTAPEAVADALRAGDLAFFVDHMPPGVGGLDDVFDSSAINLIKEYQDLLTRIVAATKLRQSVILNHKELYVLFESLVGRMPTTKVKLSKRLAHEGIEIKPYRHNKSSIRGFKLKWSASKKYLNNLEIGHRTITPGVSVLNTCKRP